MASRIRFLLTEWHYAGQIINWTALVLPSKFQSDAQELRSSAPIEIRSSAGARSNHCRGRQRCTRNEERRLGMPNNKDIILFWMPEWNGFHVGAWRDTDGPGRPLVTFERSWGRHQHHLRRRERLDGGVCRGTDPGASASRYVPHRSDRGATLRTISAMLPPSEPLRDDLPVTPSGCRNPTRRCLPIFGGSMARTVVGHYIAVSYDQSLSMPLPSRLMRGSGPARERTAEMQGPLGVTYGQ